METERSDDLTNTTTRAEMEAVVNRDMERLEAATKAYQETAEKHAALLAGEPTIRKGGRTKAHSPEVAKLLAAKLEPEPAAPRATMPIGMSIVRA